MLRGLIRTRVRSMVGGDGRAPLAYLEPAGDPGLFGPHAQTWCVHADFVSMMIGGVSALVLQALHPLALAGVWDHSSFREDLQGRLARTAQFIAATTYGGSAMAEQALARVRRIHAGVRGHHPDGRAYRADDPRLLYWVHLAETWSFLQAYREYVDPGMAQARRDAYFAEMSRIALALGCEPAQLRSGRIAQTEAQAWADLLGYRDELEYSERSRFVIELLEGLRVGQAPAALQQLMVRAGLHNLPGWAYPLLGREQPGRLEHRALRAGVRALAQPVRWALADGIAAHARRRMGAR